MSSIRKILCLFLAIAMFVPLIVGCGSLPPNTDDPSDSDSEGEQTAPDDEPPSSVINLKGYTLIRPTDCCTELSIAASQLQLALNEATGASILSEEDFLISDSQPDSNAKEILLGLTNRSESLDALKELGNQFSFSIQVKGNKIVIMGATPELTVKAVDFLFERYLPRSNGENTLTVPTSYISHPLSYQEIITDGTMNYELIFRSADQGSANFNTVVMGLSNTLSQMADTPVYPKDDWCDPDQGHDMKKKAIVVGVTTYPRSAELLADTGVYSWAFSAEGNQVYASAYETKALQTACDKLVDRLESGALWYNPKTVRICQSISPEHGAVAMWGESIPDYDGGTIHSLQEFSTDCYRLYYTKTNKSDYDNYVKQLRDAGFSLYGENTLDQNVYKTFFNNDLMLHVYYTAAKKTTSILMSSADTVGHYPKTAVSDAPVVDTPTLKMLDMNYSAQEDGNSDGMGFVFTLKDGSFVVIDGGYATEAEKLYNYMVANSPDGTPVIRAWIITSLNKDHYGCFNQFSMLYADSVTLEYFVAQFNTPMIRGDDAPITVSELRDSVWRFQNCQTIIPLTGQKMYFGTLEIDFLFTGESVYPANIDDLIDRPQHAQLGTRIQDLSLVLRATFENKTILFMSDVVIEGLKWVTANYTSALKCDYIQVPNHGLNGSNTLYNCALPQYVVLCTSESNAQSRLQTTVTLNTLMQKRNEDDTPMVKQVFSAENGYTTLVPTESLPDMQIPNFTGGVLTNNVKEFTPGYYRYYYTGSSRAAYDAYLQALVDNDFVLYGTNQIDSNVYTTYYKGSLMVHVYYLDATKTVSILTTDSLTAVAYPKAPVSDGTVTTPAFTMLDMDYDSQPGGKNNGMGFVFTLADGSYVIIDGGYATESENLYQYLVTNNKRADGKILIRAWIITHPDGDHYGTFLQFAKDHAEDVKLEYLVAQFDQDRINSGAIEGIVDAIYAAQRKFAGSRRLVPLIGQKMYFGDMAFEFLFTAEALYPTVVNSDNEHSLVIKTDFGGQTILFAADVVGVSIDWLTTHYTNALKCDFFQAPHHGLNGTTALYDLILPDYLLMTTHSTATEERLDKTHTHGKRSQLYYLMAKNCIEHVFVADNGVNGMIPIMIGTNVVIPSSN